MSYKFLINGRNTVLTEDMIRHTEDDCICFSTSDLWTDIVVHIKFMQPDAYIIPYSKDDDKNQMINRIRKLIDDAVCKEMAYVIIADPEEIEDLNNKAPYLEALKIARPTSAQEIETRTKNYIKALEKKRLEEEEKLIEMEAASKSRRAEQRAQKEQERKQKEEEKEKKKQAKEASIAALTGEAETVADPNAKKHILIVDDDRNVLKLLKTTLSDKYEVTAMLNGKMAEKYLETKTADLILLDHEMPVESGLEVFQKIKKQQCDIPVVFLTGTTDAVKIKEILSLQPRGYLLKPVDVDKLMTTIADVLK